MELPLDPAPAPVPRSADLHRPGRPGVVLYDLDGTLVDSIALIVGTYAQVFARFDVHRPTAEEMRAWIGRPLEDSFRAVDPRRAAAMTAAFRETMRADHDRGIRGYPGAAEHLDRVDRAGLRTGIVTAKRRELALRGLAATGLRPPAVLVSQEDTDRHKPDPAPLLLALERCAAGPEQTVYIGDAPTDLPAAHAAGVRAVGVTWGAGTQGELAAEGPDALVDSFAELTDLLLGGG